MARCRDGIEVQTEPNAYERFEYLEHVKLKQSDDTGGDEHEKNDDVISWLIPSAEMMKL